MQIVAELIVIAIRQPAEKQSSEMKASLLIIRLLQSFLARNDVKDHFFASLFFLLII